MPRHRTFSLGVVILAAGASTRMGRPKMLLPWGKSTVLGHLLAVWRELQANQIAIVCAAEDDGIQSELRRLGFPARHQIVNPDPSRGMFSSIQCAAAWAGWDTGQTHWAVVLGDQPHLTVVTLRTLLNFTARQPGKICQPYWQGTRRHPVVLPRTFFERIAESKEATLKRFLESVAAEIRVIELNDPGLGLDIDNPSDYEKAQRSFLG